MGEGVGEIKSVYIASENLGELIANYVVYFIFFILTFCLSVYLVRKIQSGLVSGILTSVAVGLLAGTKYECLTQAYPCGDILYQSYFPLATGIAIGLSFVVWMVFSVIFSMHPFRLGLTTKPLSGLWFVVFWMNLPRTFIHPPLHDVVCPDRPGGVCDIAQRGVCPNIPVLCHDVPLFNHGLLLWMSLPFILWAAWSFYHGFRAARSAGSG